MTASDHRPESSDPRRDDASSPAEANERFADAVLAREEQQFGYIHPGAAFFGWLAATGLSVIATGLLAAGGLVISLSPSADDLAAAAEGNEATIGLVAGVVLMVVLLVAYFCGGYVAGRMSRFHGARQGFAVWCWAVLIAVILALVAVIGGRQFDVLANLNSFPRIPLSDSELPLASIVIAVVAALVTLVGAILGGLAGMRYHRRVDRAGLGV